MDEDGGGAAERVDGVGGDEVRGEERIVKWLNGSIVMQTESEGKIQKKLEKILLELAGDNQSPALLGMSCAAPEGDILFQEACAKLGIATEVCLPIPKDAYISQAFESTDDNWRNRFLKLSMNDQKHKILEINDRDELPNWLWDSGTCHWLRGRKWIIQRALAREVANITMLVLMCEGEEAPCLDSISQLIEFAKANDKLVVNVLNMKEMLA